MTSNFDPRKDETKYAMSDGRKARRNDLPRDPPDDLNGRECRAWCMGWDIEEIWIKTGGFEDVRRKVAARQRLREAGAPVDMFRMLRGEAAK